MTRVVIVRHGETAENRDKIVQGQHPRLGRLTARGVHQAVWAGQALGAIPFDSAYCSDLERAVVTLGAILGERRKAEPDEGTLTLRFAPELREIHMGSMQGATRAQWRALVGDNARDFVPPGGESWRDVHRRVTEYLDRVIRADGAKNLLVVAHAGVIRSLIAGWLGLPLEGVYRKPGDCLPQNNACINTLWLNPQGQVTAARLNDTAHLAGHEEQKDPPLDWDPAERCFRRVREDGSPGERVVWGDVSPDADGD
ncbi:MAG: histidine phosphatase family protein [Deltaproteobacteria bacterium]|nr:histidine phosphatase family protein [Deltaproteobacteria bacterium]